MKKIAYFQCPTGISGDMCLGAIASLGVPLEYLIEKLNALGIEKEYKLRMELVHRNTQQATKVYVDLSHHHHHHENHHHGRHLPEIEEMILKAKLPHRAEDWSLAVFRQLAIAEGAVHGIAPEKVHFHEVGAVDAIVDIVGTCLGLDWLGIDNNENGLPLLYCSPLPTGGGTVKAAHGQMTVPVPAVLKLWEMRNCPVYSNLIEKELVTPTGAAIATTLAQDFGSPPAMIIKKIGLGAGSINLSLPNILRLWFGEVTSIQNISNNISHSQTNHSHIKTNHNHTETKHSHSQETETSDKLSPAMDITGSEITGSEITGSEITGLEITGSEITGLEITGLEITGSEITGLEITNLETVSVLETQIDDLSPQAIGYVFDELLAAGALDVFTQSVVMKKSRPGILVTVICHAEKLSCCEEILFKETTTLGIRRSHQQRNILQREICLVETKYGAVHVKIAWKEKNVISNIQPEYEDCADLARKYNISWREIHRLAVVSWYETQNSIKL
jgi:pyridinium-3,5-bisthiocarboxylic acid mononucleotide nickel chelatase